MARVLFCCCGLRRSCVGPIGRWLFWGPPSRIFTAKKEGRRVVVDSCSFIQPSLELSAGQIMGIRSTYQEGCDCTIVPCFSGNCGGSPSGTQCFWTQYDTATTSQEVHERCIHDSQGHCVWSWGLP